ncbi:hypothetical protein NMY22_g16759 [Coprinellus aureogranulatus]|nr:hypothetical protein NMY22_g16759 [Coprinellus aureogranulatus]
MHDHRRYYDDGTSSGLSPLPTPSEGPVPQFESGDDTTWTPERQRGLTTLMPSRVWPHDFPLILRYHDAGIVLFFLLESLRASGVPLGPPTAASALPYFLPIEIPPFHVAIFVSANKSSASPAHQLEYSHCIDRHTEAPAPGSRIQA